MIFNLVKTKLNWAFVCMYVTLHFYVCFGQQGEWSAEKAFLDQQVCLLERQNQEKASRLEQSITSLQTERQILQDRVVGSAPIFNSFLFSSQFLGMSWATGYYK